MHSKWYKKVAPFVYQGDLKESVDILNERLQKLSHKPITGVTQLSVGFSPILGNITPDEMMFQESAMYLFTITVETKKMDRNKYLKLLTEKKQQLASVSDLISIDDIPKEEVSRLESEAKKEILLKTDSKEDYVSVMLDKNTQRIYLNSVNELLIERAIKLLIKLLPDVEISSLFKEDFHLALTRWVDHGQETPEEIQLLNSAVFQQDLDAKASMTKQDLASQEITQLLHHGKEAKEVKVMFDKKLACSVKCNGRFKMVAVDKEYYDGLDKPEGVMDMMRSYTFDLSLFREMMNEFMDWMFAEVYS